MPCLKLGDLSRRWSKKQRQERQLSLFWSLLQKTPLALPGKQHLSITQQDTLCKHSKCARQRCRRSDGSLPHLSPGRRIRSRTPVAHQSTSAQKTDEAAINEGRI